MQSSSTGRPRPITYIFYFLNHTYTYSNDSNSTQLNRECSELGKNSLTSWLELSRVVTVFRAPDPTQLELSWVGRSEQGFRVYVCTVDLLLYACIISLWHWRCHTGSWWCWSWRRPIHHEPVRWDVLCHGPVEESRNLDDSTECRASSRRRFFLVSSPRIPGLSSWPPTAAKKTNYHTREHWGSINLSQGWLVLNLGENNNPGCLTVPIFAV